MREEMKNDFEEDRQKMKKVDNNHFKLYNYWSNSEMT